MPASFLYVLVPEYDTQSISYFSSKWIRGIQMSSVRTLTVAIACDSRSHERRESSQCCSRQRKLSVSVHIVNRLITIHDNAGLSNMHIAYVEYKHAFCFEMSGTAEAGTETDTM